MSSDVEAEFGPRLAATVVMATSEDDGFPASSLERHTARTRGWHTNKMPEFPVELAFSFDGLAEVRCLRLLAHESKVPSKVDLFVFTPTEEQIANKQYPPVEAADFRRLGYLSFVQNESRNFSARELKTVRIKARVLYLKLVVRGCHSNGVNLFNQAGLVGCDFHGQLLVPFGKSARQAILGLPVDSSIDTEVELTDLTPAKAPSSASAVSRPQHGGHQQPPGSAGGSSVASSRPQSASHSRNPNFDAITAQRIKQLTLHKSKAVQDEDYDVAKALKAQIDQLTAVGEKIFELEERKKAAVENEDYDVAKMLKRQIDQLRNPSAPQPPPQQPPVANQYHQQQQQYQQPPLHAAPASDPYYGAADAGDNAAPPPNAANIDDVPVGGRGGAAPVPFDDLPAVARGGNAAQPSEYPPEAYAPSQEHAPSGNDEKVAMSGGAAANAESGGIVVLARPAAERDGVPVPVSTAGMPVWERQINEKIVNLAGAEEPHAPSLDAPKLKEYQAYTDAFGLYCCSCLFAKRWQLRDAALRAIVSPDGFSFLTSGVRPPNQGSPSAVLQAILSYLDAKTTGVSDSISQVFFSVCDAIKAIVSEDLQGAPVVAAVHGLASLLPALMLKAGDSNQRVREKAQTTLFMLAMSPVGPERVSAAALHDPQKGQKKPLNYRVHSARIALARILVAKVGLNRKEQRTGLTAENVTKGLCVPLLAHANGDVRDAAIGLIVLLHDSVPDSVMQKLLSDVKPLQLQVIEEQLAESRQGGGNRGTGGEKQSELASSSISVERGGRHPVLDAARTAAAAAAPPAKDEAPPAAAGGGPKSTKQRQEEEREAAERAARTCQFCGRHDPKFTDDLLDDHYARACPMLIACPLCQQVTEIPTLQQHLIGECNRATAVRQCPTCREAVPVGEFDEHVAASACIPHSAQYNVCPLCHDKLPPTEQGWDDHLLKAPGCPNNSRAYDGKGGGAAAEL